jgi:aqualysin 1
MRKRLILLLIVFLSLGGSSTLFGAGQTSTTTVKFRRAANPIPNRYIVVLATTNLDPVVDVTPAPAPTTKPVSASDLSQTGSYEASTAFAPDADQTATSNLLVGQGVVVNNPAPPVSPAPADDPQVVATAESLTQTYGGARQQTWGEALKGFLLNASEATAIAMSEDSRVAFVEEDGTVNVDPLGTPDNDPIVMGNPYNGSGPQLDAPWGLDRIDQRLLPLSRSYSFAGSGLGVNAYVIDTGIYPTHADFRGRAFASYDALGENGIDCNGHGTHVAGIIGSSTFGVAKNVRLHGVRVLSCSGSGTWSDVIRGINWVTWHRQQPAQRNSPAVANLSLGGGVETSVDVAVRNSIRANVTYVVAAGNANADARLYSPGRLPEAITVAATDIIDHRGTFSNWGPAIDLFAPGVQIPSTWIGGELMSRTLSGTSMASPHVAGVAALYLQSHQSASPAAVRSALVGVSTSGILNNVGEGTPNRMLFTSN